VSETTPPRGTVVRPLLRWAGSKRSILPTLVACAPNEYGTYLEPFAGSACLFARLRPQRAILGDINADLIAFYRTIAKKPLDVAYRAAAMPRSSKFYYDLRKRWDVVDPVDQAARFVYLNRFCFNGVYRTDKEGHFNVPRGRKVGALPDADTFLAYSVLLRRSKLLVGDFEECMNCAAPGDLAYLDPPYTTCLRKPRGEYGYDSFEGTDLGRLIRCLHGADKRGIKVLLSYKKEPELETALRTWSRRVLLVRRHVAGFARHRAVTAEILLANYELPSQRALRRNE
jgi:DNA adenine methylase